MSYIAIQRKIAKGKGLLAFSIVFAVLVRVLYYYLSGDTYVAKDYPDAGYLWHCIEPIFSQQIYSMLSAIACVILLALLCNYIDVKNVILREKSSLAPAYVILLFSSHTAFFEMSPYFLAILLFLWAVEQLFGAYHSDVCTIPAANISSIIALASLIEPVLLLYLMLFIVGFSLMNILNVKSLISALLGVVFIYVPVYVVSIVTNTESQFVQVLGNMSVENLLQLPILSFDYAELILGLFVCLIFGWLCIHNYMTRYKDKIRTRIFISFMGLIQLLAFLCLYLFNVNFIMNIYIGITIGAILLAHYFTVTVQRIMIFIFWLMITGCLLSIYMSFVD